MSNDSTPDPSPAATDDLTTDRSPAETGDHGEPAADAAPARKKRTTKRKTTRKKVAKSDASVAKAPSRRKRKAKVEPEVMAPEADAGAADTDDPARAVPSPGDGPDFVWSDPAGGGDADRSGSKKQPAADADQDADDDSHATAHDDGGSDERGDDEADADGGKPRRKRRRRKKSGRGSGEAEASGEPDAGDAAEDAVDAAATAAAAAAAAADADAVADDDGAEDEGATRGRSKKKSKRTSSSGGRSTRSRGRESEVQSGIVEPLGDEMMIINDLADDECRIAVLEEGHLEEIFVERVSTATNVGNIYKGRVVNIEPAIQAAFVDYGQGANGFLHISDLHPKYFPGEGPTERVGKKTPRRERPSIQQALKRGQEILVQVLKEGIGTKGPTLTSYLSIPGRLLVMMPDMDRVGVSRKVDDDDSRREMRKILDALDLPDGFGFILRTAGMGRTKTEIKRDVAYLTRLWKQMEKRIDKVGAPCPLYTESDLVIRTVRDVLRPSIKSIVVDSQSAYDRVSAFLRVVAPRSAPRVVRYARSTPIFHAFGVERQIDLIHAREVPLPSGGALVIDQTEALVAIDVNSGKSRTARDSETNAFRTNCEAVDEIARQLRLRDLGGLVVNDLIDMRHARHRKDIEDRFRENLKRDRARTSISRISEFGLIEMTRQRMRPSLRKGQYTPCPICQGRGEVQAPDSLGAEVIRHVALFLDQPRVARLEVVCSPRVSSVLLSRKRRQLVHLEDHTGKQVDVRVSDDIPVDRVDYYAYDERNADLDLQMFQPRKQPKLDDLEHEAANLVDAMETGDEIEDMGSGEAGGRRRRRRRKPGPADATAIALSEGLEEELAAIDEEEAQEEAAAAAAEARYRDRGSAAESDGATGDRGPAHAEDDEEGDGEGGRKRRRRRRRRRRRDGEGDEGEGKANAGGDRPDRDRERDRDRNADAAPATAPTPAPVPAEPMKVFELAKELEVKSRVILDAAAEMQITVTSHMNRLSGEDVRRLRERLAPAAAPSGNGDGDGDAGGGSEGGRPEPESEDRGSRRDERGSADDGADARDRGDADRDDERDDDNEEGGRKRRRRRRRRRRRKGGDGDEGTSHEGRDREAESGDDGGGGGGGGGGSDREPRSRASAASVTPVPESHDRARESGDAAPVAGGGGAATTEPKPKRRPLYGSRKRVPRSVVVESAENAS